MVRLAPPALAAVLLLAGCGFSSGPAGGLERTVSATASLTLVRFSTSQSIRDGVLFLINELPPAGYTPARGDAEASEADAPFVKGDVRGVMRIIATGQCQTDWLLALAAPGGGPVDQPARRPAVSC